MGSGAVGGYFGAVLHRGGHGVRFVARGEQLQAIKERGLRIESAKMGDFTIRPRVLERADGSWKAELALFCVKGYDNAEAIAAMAPAVDRDTSVLTLQNGIGSADELGAAFGRERVLLGVTHVDAVRREPGVVGELGGETDIIFGEESGGRTPRAVAVRDALEVEGIDVKLSADIVKELWSKLVLICALSGMTSITNAPLVEVLHTPETLDLTRRVIREAEAVARAKGTHVDEDIERKTMAYFEDAKWSLSSSMHEDVRRGSRLEVGVLNGAVARLGSELGVPTPVNEFIAACLAVAHNRAAAERG